MHETKRLTFGVALGMHDDGPELAADARKVESWGFDAVFAGDHLPGRWMEPFGPLTWAAASTERLRIGTGVVAIDFRNPIMLAKQVASLDRLCGGRLQLGIGAGWWDRDYAMLGIPFDPPGVRISRMAEALHLLRRYWQGEPFTFEGQFYSVREVDPGPAPYRPGGPPIMIGGGGPRIMRIAGREADIVGPNPQIRGGRISKEYFDHMRREAVAEKLRWAREGAESAGRDPSALTFDSAANYLAVCDSAAEADEMIGRIVSTTPLSAEDVRDAPTVLVGTPEMICARILRDRDELGFTEFALPGGEIRGFATIGRPAHELFARHVLPLVRQAE